MEGMEPPTRVGRELDESFKLALVRYLQGHMTNGKLAHGAYSKAATLFAVHPETASRIWKSFLAGDVKSKKAGHVGRKVSYNNAETLWYLKFRSGIFNQ